MDPPELGRKKQILVLERDLVSETEPTRMSLTGPAVINTSRTAAEGGRGKKELEEAMLG